MGPLARERKDTVMAKPKHPVDNQRNETLVETSVHDSWAMLSLVAYSLLDVLMRVDVADGYKANSKDAVFNLDAEGLEAAWGCLETVRAARDKLDTVMRSF